MMTSRFQVIKYRSINLARDIYAILDVEKMVIATTDLDGKLFKTAEYASPVVAQLVADRLNKFFESGEKGNAVAEFHRQRGCCDGSDPVRCWNDRNRELDRIAAERKAEREYEKRQARLPRNEYEGTE